MRYFFFFIFIIGCDNPDDKIDNALNKCATNSYTISTSRLLDNDSEKIAQTSIIYKEKINKFFKIYPKAKINRGNDFEKAYAYTISFKDAKVLFDEIERFRRAYIFEKISEMKIKEKKKLPNYVLHFESCENFMINNPRTFNLKFK